MTYRRSSRFVRREHAVHADDWLMTYADMITLLLCFFAIFLSVSIPKKDGPQKTDAPQAVQVVVQAPAQRHTLPVVQGLDPIDPAAAEPLDEPHPDIGVPVTPPKMEKSATAIDDATGHHDQVSVQGDDPALKTGQAAQAAAPVEAPVTLPQIVDNLKAQGQPNAATIDQKGDRITTLEISSAAFFDSGSAVLRKDGKVILSNVSTNLKSEKFKDYQITVEGHTDDSPIDTAQFPSNWELSTARAAAVVRFFLEQGIPAAKLRAAGYADTFPKLPNRNAAGGAIPENQAQNRRVVIKLEKIVKDAAASGQPAAAN